MRRARSPSYESVNLRSPFLGAQEIDSEARCLVGVALDAVERRCDVRVAQVAAAEHFHEADDPLQVVLDVVSEHPREIAALHVIRVRGRGGRLDPEVRLVGQGL